MKIEFLHGGRRLVITTDHAASSYGQPVLLVDGKITDAVIGYEPDEPDPPSFLDQLADHAGIWNGPATRRALHQLAEELYPGGVPDGAAADAVVAEFARRGRDAEGRG